MYALVCVVFGVTFKEIPPPIHPKTQPELHVVVPIEDSCYNPSAEKAVADIIDGDTKTPKVLLRSIDSVNSVDIAVLAATDAVVQ